jgi:hypothetical protein
MRGCIWDFFLSISAIPSLAEDGKIYRIYLRFCLPATSQEGAAIGGRFCPFTVLFQLSDFLTQKKQRLL